MNTRRSRAARGAASRERRAPIESPAPMPAPARRAYRVTIIGADRLERIDPTPANQEVTNHQSA